MPSPYVRPPRRYHRGLIALARPRPRRGSPLSDRTYRVTEIVGTSSEGIDAAIRNAVRRASTTLRHVDWFEVTQVRGQIKAGDVEHFQVGLKIGFWLEDE
jgi:flavin-binding protein dodecin